MTYRNYSNSNVTRLDTGSVRKVESRQVETWRFINYWDEASLCMKLVISLFETREKSPILLRKSLATSGKWVSTFRTGPVYMYIRHSCKFLRRQA